MEDWTLDLASVWLAERNNCWAWLNVQQKKTCVIAKIYWPKVLFLCFLLLLLLVCVLKKGRQTRLWLSVGLFGTARINGVRVWCVLERQTKIFIGFEALVHVSRNYRRWVIVMFGEEGGRKGTRSERWIVIWIVLGWYRNCAFWKVTLKEKYFYTIWKIESKDLKTSSKSQKITFQNSWQKFQFQAQWCQQWPLNKLYNFI